MIALPKILVAPTGARRGKSDHPALPVTIEEIVDSCRACAAAGAGGVHAHIRADDGSHSLDLERYRTLVARLEDVFPGWFVQVTSEAAGRYDAADQRTLIRSLKPKAVTAAIRELVRMRQPRRMPERFITGRATTTSRSSISASTTKT